MFDLLCVFDIFNGFATFNILQELLEDGQRANKIHSLVATN